MTKPALKLMISLHDVTPFHLDRMQKAEKVFLELGVKKIAYLFVPEYHGSYPSAENPEFTEWCGMPRPFHIDWQLHGYHHLENPPMAISQVNGLPGFGDAFKRRFMTAGEGEFLALDPDSQRQKLAAGRDAFRRCLKSEPVGFVAPAWLFNSRLPALLKQQGFRYTEDHRRIYRVDTGSQIASPVITWATRTVLRKYGSLVVCPALARLWAKEPVLRVAVHPFDFDHQVTTTNIKSVLRKIIAVRDQVCWEDLQFPTPIL